MPATQGEGQTSVQKPTPPNWQLGGAKSFIDRRRGPYLSSDSHLQIGLTSIILIVLGTANLQFQGPLVPISLSPVLRTVATCVVGTVWS